jgi:hypothetical protein
VCLIITHTELHNKVKSWHLKHGSEITLSELLLFFWTFSITFFNHNVLEIGSYLNFHVNRYLFYGITKGATLELCSYLHGNRRHFWNGEVLKTCDGGQSPKSSLTIDLFSVCSDEPTQSANPVSVHAFFDEH